MLFQSKNICFIQIVGNTHFYKDLYKTNHDILLSTYQIFIMFYVLCHAINNAFIFHTLLMTSMSAPLLIKTVMISEYAS